MKKIITVYNYHAHDWYVGELYRYFIERLKEQYSTIYFEVTDSYEFQKKYNLNDYNTNFPTILNKYNFVLYNPENDKTFINSLNDYAPFCLYPNGGVEYFDVKCFSFAPNHSDDLIKPILQYNPTPSFYILENWSDIEKINQYKKTKKQIKKAYFLGLLYGRRISYEKSLKNSDLFDIQDKRFNYKNKDDYYATLSQHLMSFGVDGAAKICYRDIESLGLGCLLVREKLDIKTYNPLIENKHYIELITPKEKLLIDQYGELGDMSDISKLLEDRIDDILSDDDRINYIIHEGLNWYENNCLPSKQFEMIENMTNNLEILI